MTLTIDQALARPNSRKPVLAELVTGQHLFHWINDATYTNTWYATTSHVVDFVKEDSAELTQVFSLSDCNNVPGTWYWDRSAERVYIHSNAADPYQATVLALVHFRFSNFPKVFGGEPYVARLTDNAVPDLFIEIPARFGEGGKSSSGDVSINSAQGNTVESPGFFDELNNLHWDAGWVRIRAGADPVY